MTIRNVSRSKPFTPDDPTRNHNELVRWHDWFCKVDTKDGKDFLVLKSYEGPELRFPVDLKSMIDPETNEPFTSVHGIRHAVLCALHNSVRCLVQRALGNAESDDDRSGWRPSPDGTVRRYGYDYLDWESE